MRRPERRLPALLPLLLLLLGLSACGTSDAPGVYKVGRPYQIAGRWYYPEFDPDYDAIGVASWYGEPFHGRATANGERFDKTRISAAHPTLPLPSIVRVTNLENHRTIELRVNDRGPFVGDRIIDLSQAAAFELGFERRGTVPVRVQFVRLAEAEGTPPAPSPRTPPPETRVARAEPAVPRTAASAQGPEKTVVVGARAEAGRSPVCTGHFVQVGAFAEAVRAERFAARLSAALATPATAGPPRDDHLARVRVGPLASEAEARAMLAHLRASGLDGFVVKPRETFVHTC